MDATDRESPYKRICDIIRAIPKGRVATYGQVAQLAGLPGHARQVGYALHRLPDGTDVPWQRVINARGRISMHSEPVGRTVQRILLESEGVIFGGDGSVALCRYQWQPRRPILSAWRS